MKYLSIDLEATGLDQDCYIIEFAAMPFDAEKRELNTDNVFHSFVQCPSYDELKDKLHPWVIENNEALIRIAHKKGLEMSEFKRQFENYLTSPAITEYFRGYDNIILFGKSLNAIDLPFMNRDLGWDFMRKYFHHRVMDFSSYCMGLIDMGDLPIGHDSGHRLMEYLNMGEVSHTALEDAQNTAIMYIKLLEKLNGEESDDDED